MKKTLIILFLFAVVGNLSAEISVKSFRKLENDLDARVNAPIRDFSGDVSAIIKVVTNQTGFSFDCGQAGIVKTVNKPSEIWVYVPYGVKHITILHPQLGQLRDWYFTQPIEKATVYEMVLTTGKVITTVDSTLETKFLIITSTPSWADVFINDQHRGQTPFIKEMAVGEYDYRVTKDFYYPTAGKVNLISDSDKVTIPPLVLKPNFGFAQISSIPEDGMTVTLDGKVLSQTTPLKTDTLSSGKHSISIEKTFFHPQSKEIIINDNKTTIVEFTLKPAFGSLSLKSLPEPEGGADVSLDGKPTGLRTPCKLDRLVSGKHTIKLQNKWYEPTIFYVEINDGVDLTDTVELKPNFGVVQLNSDNESELFIDNQSKGNGKWEGRLMAGLHSFEAKKERHHPVLQKIEIQVDETKQINLNPQPIVGKLKIVTNAIGAVIKLNEKEYGTTPSLISDLFAGNYKLSLEKEGFRKFYKDIVIEEGKITEVNDMLYTGLKVEIQSSPHGAQLFVDNKEKGRTPLTLMLNIGKHNIKLVNGKKIIEETIMISEDANTTFSYDVNEVVSVIFNGSLGVNSVNIDEKYVGKIPFTTKLNIGTHVIKIEKGNEVLEKKITVMSDGKNEFNFTHRDFTKSFYRKHFLAVSYAYHQTTFANTAFNERIANGSLTKDYAHAATIYYNLYPLEITATAFFFGLRTHDLAPFINHSVITHRGVEFCVNYMPVNIGTSVVPYIGAGYQLSQIYCPDGSMAIDGSASTNTSMPVVKGGLRVKLGQLFILGEYKHTFPLNGSSYSSQQLSGGIGWMF